MGDGSKDRYINTPSSLTMILSRVLLLFDPENAAIRIGMTCPITPMVLPIRRKKVNLTKAFLISPCIFCDNPTTNVACGHYGYSDCNDIN